MPRRVWKAVEAKIREVRMAEAEGGRKEGRRRKETKRERKEKEETKEKKIIEIKKITEEWKI